MTDSATLPPATIDIDHTITITLDAHAINALNVYRKAQYLYAQGEPGSHQRSKGFEAYDEAGRHLAQQIERLVKKT
jgi:hypothetical protein